MRISRAMPGCWKVNASLPLSPPPFSSPDLHPACDTLLSISPLAASCVCGSAEFRMHVVHSRHNPASDCPPTLGGKAVQSLCMSLVYSLSTEARFRSRMGPLAHGRLHDQRCYELFARLTRRDCGLDASSHLLPQPRHHVDRQPDTSAMPHTTCCMTPRVLRSAKTIVTNSVYRQFAHKVSCRSQ